MGKRLFSPHHDRHLTTDSVEKVGFSARLHSGTATSGEPIHHVAWFFGKRTGKPSCTTKPDATYAAATLQSHLPAA